MRILIEIPKQIQINTNINNKKNKERKGKEMQNKENNLTIQARWKQLTAMANEQKLERFKDVEILMENLSKKVQTSSESQLQKNALLHHHIGNQQNELIHLREIMNNLIENRSRIVEDQAINIEGTLMQEMTETEKLCKRSIKKIEDHSQRIKNQMERMESKYQKQTMEMYKQFQMTKDAIRSLLIEGKIKYGERMEVLAQAVDEEVSDLTQYIQKYGEDRKEAEIRMRYMVEDLLMSLEKAVEVESKEGTIVQDCLLALIEDSNSKIHQSLKLR